MAQARNVRVRILASLRTDPPLAPRYVCCARCDVHGPLWPLEQRQREAHQAWRDLVDALLHAYRIPQLVKMVAPRPTRHHTGGRP